MTTNRDKINAMTNEELAELLIDDCSFYCTSDCADCGYETDCVTNIVKWLESEVEE